MNPQIKINEQLKLAGIANPATVASNAVLLTGAVDMSKYHRVIAVLALGNMSNETADFKLESDTVSTFDSSAATVVAATQLAASAAANDNKQIILEAKAEDLPAGDRYLRGSAVTGSTGGGPACITIWGVPRYSNEANATSVVEVKSA